MIILKFILSILIVVCATKLGIEISKKYVFREKELYEFKNAFNMMETKVRYTYEPLKDIFSEIADTTEKSVGRVFRKVSMKIETNPAKRTWEEAIDESQLYIVKEDKDILKGFGKLLGKTDKLGQISEIKLILELLDKQIEKASLEREKNEKLYKKMGLILGVSIVIILI